MPVSNLTLQLESKNRANRMVHLSPARIKDWTIKKMIRKSGISRQKALWRFFKIHFWIDQKKACETAGL